MSIFNQLGHNLRQFDPSTLVGGQPIFRLSCVVTLYRCHTSLEFLHRSTAGMGHAGERLQGTGLDGFPRETVGGCAPDIRFAYRLVLTDDLSLGERSSDCALPSFDTGSDDPPTHTTHSLAFAALSGLPAHHQPPSHTFAWVALPAV
jgi:hypothetical protein